MNEIELVIDDLKGLVEYLTCYDAADAAAEPDLTRASLTDWCERLGDAMDCLHDLEMSLPENDDEDDDDDEDEDDDENGSEPT